MVAALECTTTCLLDLPSVLDHHETVLTFAFQRWLKFLLCTFPQWQWHHRQTLRSTPPGLQGLSPTRHIHGHSYMIEFPARKCEHVSILHLYFYVTKTVPKELGSIQNQTIVHFILLQCCLLYTSPSPRD